MSFHRTREVKATRKIHTCEGCFEKIAKGSPAVYQVGSWYYGFYDYYLCIPCKEFATKHHKLVRDDVGGFFLSGEIPSIRKELEEREKETK